MKQQSKALKTILVAKALCVALCLPTICAAAEAPANQSGVRDFARDAKAIVAKLTLEEKVNQLLGVWLSKSKFISADLAVDRNKLAQSYPLGIAHYGRPGDGRGPGSGGPNLPLDCKGSRAVVNALQSFQRDQTRARIPVLIHGEGLHGHFAQGATSFPQAIALASSWDAALVESANAITAREMRACGEVVALSPVVDIARDPRWGRTEETFGEDPYLSGIMGTAAVRGLQGGIGTEDALPADRVFATLKHMTGHSQPQSGTNVGPASIGQRELREDFLRPFEMAIRAANPAIVMPSYNEIDGVPSHGSAWLLRDVLRGDLKFKGAVFGDYGAVEQLMNLHHVAASLPDGARQALAAGVDVDLPEGGGYSSLVTQVRSGAVSEQSIDTAAARVVELKLRAGLFDRPLVDGEAARLIDNAEARALALRAAERSVVLLSNDGTLPLKPTGAIAVIGPNSDFAQLGGYSGRPRRQVSLVEGIRAFVGSRASVLSAPGVRLTTNDRDADFAEPKLADPVSNAQMIRDAVAVAQRADVIVLNIGEVPQISREAWGAAHLGDTASLDLVGEQQMLYDALRTLGKPIVVVLTNGRPLSTVKVADSANALLESWYLGQDTGTALARILFGAVSPGGKLPITIPRSIGQLPSYYSVKPSARRGYLFETTKPLFPFGWGLSYSKFKVGAPQLSASRIRADQVTTVSVGVTNTGGMTADETVQLYVQDESSSVTRPIKELRGFERVTLQPGESRTVTFRIDGSSLEMWDAGMNRVVEPGTFRILTGPNSVDLQSAELEVGE